MSYAFTLLGDDAGSAARRGRLQTLHGVIETPTFMPVGTLGTVKGVTPAQLKALGAQVILGNTYHLYLRPGMEVVEALGGLHRMAGWDRPILTDSGGFQVFSLRDRSTIRESGVTFSSHLDGSRHVLTPESAIAIQETLGSDIMMVFDECPPADASAQRVRAAMERTTRWAKRCLEARTRDDNALFGIVQGGVDPQLREVSARAITEIGFDGYALGGLSVGEGRYDMWRSVRHAAPLLPTGSPRYLMGVGTPEDLLFSVGHGIDMFDCVLPTRNARNARVFTFAGDLNLRNAAFRLDDRPISDTCDCYTCTNFSRGYLRHLHKAKELLFSTLTSIHNLGFLIAMMGRLRSAIEDGTFVELRRDLLAKRGCLELLDQVEAEAPR